MSKINHLPGSTIVITGASSGAGRAAALEFAKQGCNLVLAARNEAALNEVKAECESLGAQALVVVTDTSESRSMINLANAAIDWQDRIDVWVNNAGVLAAGDFDKMPMAVHEQVIKTNLLGYMNGAHAVLPFFKEQGRGILINNISIGGFLPVPYGAGYTAAKFGLRGWSEALKAELTEFPEIYVCDLFPAFLDTPGIQHAGNHTGKLLKPAPPVYDPARLAQTMVKVAQGPSANTYVGSVSLLLKFGHAVFPELMTKATGFVMRRYLNSADPIPLSDGNVFTTVDYGMSTHGGFGLPGAPKAHRKYIAGALLVGIAAGSLLFFRRFK
ncbi:SDR family oxidoreductase [Mucilaginibacter myungsuensis]|uniref:SDR family oxidoreductase n=1 Tax=Mucilaginibacter myungsuensis TaxID=649104 RepID=A0A929KXU5_9SPHI|nr:SDR family oxidoreductase [Mucilaginibacter myungsuensis]MBE9663162.1 SDR family oxidoreductase [Mucilaginibacter myungsuensis]MDN3598797.1 SDR family oxidoreductase [Mucilaginibacter myungsuensis]